MRTLNPQVLKETMAECGVGSKAFSVDARGKKLTFVNRDGDLKEVSLAIGIGESESAVIAKIHKAAACDAPEYLDI